MTNTPTYFKLISAENICEITEGILLTDAELIIILKNCKLKEIEEIATDRKLIVNNPSSIANYWWVTVYPCENRNIKIHLQTA